MLITENTLQEISRSKDMRMGISYSKECHAPFLEEYFSDCKIRLKQLCYIEKGTIITENDTEDGDIPVVAGGKVQAYFHNKSNRSPNVITVSASGAYSGFVNFWSTEIWASDCITIISKNEDVIITKFLYYILKLIQEDIYLLQKGADQPHVYADDIKKIRIPFFPIELQRAILDKIELIESRISMYKKKEFRNIKELVSKCFGDYFSYDYDTYNRLKQERIFNCDYSSFGKNIDIRFSTKFYRPAGAFVYKELLSRPFKKLKDIISEPIILGASISPKEFDNNGVAYYISMATIKNFEVELDNSQLVSTTYYDSNKAKSVHKDDIILARSGVAIGKTAIVRKKFKGIFADFTMRVRIDKSKCIPLFAFYYFRSEYFQYLIEINKKGLQNQNIFPINIQEFPFPDLMLSEQQKIIDNIELEINTQKTIEKKIAEKNKAIESILKKITL